MDYGPPRSAFFEMDREVTKARGMMTTKAANLRPDMINTHLPAKALNYLQMVDEPSVDGVISKFGGHSFQEQFKKPLE